jgi:hypothetical protein
MCTKKVTSESAKGSIANVPMSINSGENVMGSPAAYLLWITALAALTGR